ncbi:MAG: iron-containing alcohol dehydrogenase [Rhodospirillales bacterium]
MQDSDAVRSFRFTGTQEVLHGPGALTKLPQAVKRLGGERVFIVTNRSLATKTGHVEAVQRLLGRRWAGTMAAVRQHAPQGDVAAAAQAAGDAGADLLIGLGGGSPIDSAKAVAGRLAREGRALPQIAIPTTLSAGEFTPIAAATDEASGIKEVRVDHRLTPATVILDPVVTRETPRQLWASSGIKALDHAIEVLLAVQPHPLADLLAGEAIRRLRRSLLPSLADPFDLEARADCQFAAWLSIAGLPSVGIRLSHLIGHQVGARWGIPHGVTSCITLPHCMRHLAAETLPQQAGVAAAFGLRQDGPPSLGLALAAADEVAAFIARLGVPTRLSEAGARTADLETVAAAVAAETASGGSEPQSPEAILALLRLMW